MRRPARALALACAGLLLAAACSERTEGMALEVGLMHHPGDGHEHVHYPAGAERGIVTDKDYGVVLRRALLVVSRVELQPCEEDTARAALRGLRELLWPVSVAHAHGENTPTVLAVPNVLDLIDEDRNTIALARMEPPPGEYCGVILTADAADDDAVGLPGDGSLDGRTLLAEGVFVAPGEGTEQPFSYSSELEDEVELPFVDTGGEPTRLRLSADAPMAELRLEVGYYGMLDGIDLAEPDALVDSFRVIRNLLSNARAVVTELRPEDAPAGAP